MPQCTQAALIRKVLATCLQCQEKGNGLLAVPALVCPSVCLLGTTCRTKQCSLELPFELFVMLKLTQ